MTLEEFTDDWLRDSPIKPPIHSYQQVSGYVGLTLYRDDRFQVQMWTFPPYSEVTEHSHPDVDSILVKVTGKFRLILNGKWMSPREVTRTQWRGMNTWMTGIKANDRHGVRVGGEGASFLSISERLDGLPPESVHMVWEGPPLDEAHAAELENH
jgi:quercetin dioxygenase-like cupin family protein